MSYPKLFTTPGLGEFADAVDAERARQLAKWGDQRHSDGTGTQHYVALADSARADVEIHLGQHSGPEWALILLEEVYEALAESDPVKLCVELVQCAAVIQAWISDLDRRGTDAARRAVTMSLDAAMSTSMAAEIGRRTPLRDIGGLGDGA